MKYLSKEAMSRQRGGVIVKILLFIPLLVLLVFGFYEGRKAYWDYQVKAMCEKDGGPVVQEKVPIPNKYIDKDGIIHIPAKPANPNRPLSFEAKPTDAFYYEWINEPIKIGYLAVGKHTLNIIRSSDNKILGSMVVYSRSGGDFPTFAHPSSISCPDTKDQPDLLKLVFLK